MPTTRTRCRLTLEVLEERLPLSTMHGVHPVEMPARQELKGSAAYTIPPGNTLTVLAGFTAAYPSFKGQPKYNPVYDLNHNGQVGQTDGRILLHHLPPVSPKVPLTLNVALAPPYRVRGPVTTSLGGATHSQDPTIVGHTTPGALVYIGTGTLDQLLREGAVVANAKGEFSFKDELSDGINELDLEAVTPYNQQLNFDFPIIWLGFFKYERTHPGSNLGSTSP